MIRYKANTRWTEIGFRAVLLLLSFGASYFKNKVKKSKEKKNVSGLVANALVDVARWKSRSNSQTQTFTYIENTKHTGSTFS